MNKRIVFRNMDHSDVMENYANQQLEKIEEFLSHVQKPITIDLYFEPSKVHQHHRVELHVRCGHYDLNSSYEREGADFYDVLDRVVDTMYRNILEEKRRYDDMKKQSGRHDDFKKER
jgi:ribosomal subunit interface protein